MSHFLSFEYKLVDFTMEGISGWVLRSGTCDDRVYDVTEHESLSPEATNAAKQWAESVIGHPVEWRPIDRGTWPAFLGFRSRDA